MVTCPVCGVENSTGGLCPSCYLRENPPFSVKTPLKRFVCPLCNSYKKGNRWIQVSGGNDPFVEIALDAARHAVQLESSDQVAWENQPRLSILGRSGEALPLSVGVRVEVTGRLRGGGEAYTGEAELEVRLEKRVCPSCSRRKGKSFTTILQIRAENRGLTSGELETIKRIVTLSGGLSHVVSLEEEHGGVNIKTSNSRVARRIAEKIRAVFGGTLSGTAKLVTRDRQTGKRVYRGTLLLRIPEYCVDDTVSYCDRYWVVKQVTGGKVVLSGLDEDRVVAVPWARAAGIQLVKKSGDYHPAVVTLRTSNMLQVYDMVTCENLDVEHGLWLDMQPGERTRIVRLDGKTLVVPP